MRNLILVLYFTSAWSSYGQVYNVQEYLEVTNFTSSSNNQLKLNYAIKKKKESIFKNKKIEFNATIQVFWKNLKIYTTPHKYIAKQDSTTVDFQIDLSNVIIPEGKQELTVKLVVDTHLDGESYNIVALERTLHTQVLEVTQKKYGLVDLTIEEIQLNERDSNGDLWDEYGFDDEPEPFVILNYQKDKTHNFGNGAIRNLHKTLIHDPKNSIWIDVFDDDFFSRDHMLGFRFSLDESKTNKTIESKLLNGKIRYRYALYPQLVEPELTFKTTTEQSTKNPQLLVDFSFAKKSLIGTTPEIQFYLLDTHKKVDFSFHNESNETHLAGKLKVSPLWFVGNRAKLYCSVRNGENELYSFCMIDSIGDQLKHLTYVDFGSITKSYYDKGFRFNGVEIISDQLSPKDLKSQVYVTDKKGNVVDEVLLFRTDNLQTKYFDYKIQFKPEMNLKAAFDTIYFVRDDYYVNAFDSIPIGKLSVPFDFHEFCYVDTLFFKIPKPLFAKASDYWMHFQMNKISPEQFTKKKGFITVCIPVHQMINTVVLNNYYIYRNQKKIGGSNLKFLEENKNMEHKLKRKGFRHISYRFN